MMPDAWTEILSSGTPMSDRPPDAEHRRLLQRDRGGGGSPDAAGGSGETCRRDRSRLPPCALTGRGGGSLGPALRR